MNHHKSVCVTRVISRNGGGAIFKGATGLGDEITVVAPYDVVAESTIERDDVWIATGRIEVHPRYGLQLHAADLELDLPRDDLLLDYLIKSPRFRNFDLGEKKVKNLWKTYGDKLASILDRGEIDLLTCVAGISEQIAAELVARWRDNAGEIEVRKWLKSHRIDPRLARKIIKIWGNDAINHLEHDPYELARFLPWEMTDRLAQSLGIAGGDTRRLVGAVETALFKRLDAADTLVPHKIMISMVKSLLGMKGDVVQQAIYEAEKALVLIGDEQKGYQHRGIARLERKIRERFHNIMAGESGSQISLFARLVTEESIARGIHKVKLRISAETGKPTNLTDDQIKAVNMAIKEPLSIICGGAGTGKTTILLAIHEIHSIHNIPIYQMALPSIAAQRIKDSTEHGACTIAKFCMEVRTGKRTVADDALFIIDESSMVDLSTMYRFLSYVPLGARILFVGDPHQLSPVSFGLVFHILVACGLVPKVELKAVHRQKKSTGIPEIAQDIREYKVPINIQYHSALPKNLGDLQGVHFIECPDLERGFPLSAENVVWDFYKELGQNPDEIRYLAAIKGRSVGVDSINRMLLNRLNKVHSFVGTDQWKFAVNEEIIYLDNDDELGLNNGSLGTVLELKKNLDGWVMVAEWADGETREVPESKFSQIEPAYAMTVHKAQGSQFKKIICPIFKSKNLDNSLIYTALTRGQEQVVFFGDRKVFEDRIKMPSSWNTRRVGFAM